MNLVRCAMLYAGFALCANAALADQAAVEALRKGDMEKLVFVSPAKPLPDAVLLDACDGLPEFPTVADVVARLFV